MIVLYNLIKDVKKMKINIVGLGYIGLPTALTMANAGYDVIGTDVNEELVEKLKKGEVTFKENGLQELFNEALKNKIDFTTKYEKAGMYIISVPTPYDKFSKKVDSTYVINAVKNVLEACEDGAIIVIESTISPGTIDKQIKPLINKKVHLVHAPERIIPGNMIYELKHNSRTIGADDTEIGKKVAEIYQKTTDGEVIVTSIKCAEMTKVVENTFRAVNIAFANELAKICSHDNMNVYEIIKICNMHPRVNILNPGPGVGGHCISVDPWFLVGDYPELAKLIGVAMHTNEDMPGFVLKRASEIMKENNLTDYKKVGIYGLTYKENVDDYRESPTLQLLEMQKNHLAEPLKVYDPFIKKDIVENQCHNLKEFLNDIDLVIIMVKHQEIIDNMNLLKDKIVLDTQNICHFKNVNRL